MNFKTFSKVCDVLTESTKVENALSGKIRPSLYKQVINILNNNTYSKLSKYIIRRIHNPDTVETQKLVPNKVGKLDSYDMDPSIYEQLIDVKDSDVGPGEILTALTLGEWTGGTNGDSDITVDGLGNIEVKYLSPFAKSTNVPMGSAHSKRIARTDIPNIFNGVERVVRSNPRILKRYLTPEEVEYFIDESMDQLDNDGGDVSTNTIRLVGRLLKKSEKMGDKTFSSNKLTFERLTNAMRQTLSDAMGEADYMMFIGDKVKDKKNIGGMYYLMPKEAIRYWHFYRIYDGERIKIAPFTTEKDFFETRIYNK